MPRWRVTHSRSRMKREMIAFDLAFKCTYQEILLSE